ncbi:MAG: 3-deoxy-manno-octulosonate cytidylyltransferase [Alteromonadaceae bacterium]|nr:MAG: 3-deoxy-manno-octulosonate cytidylyltransferase [Alteromonadaceae bacterium]
MNFTVVIPARYASSRLPAKPLADIAGKPMIEHVYRRACLSQAQRVVVATDDARIVEVVERFGGQVCMTSDQHPSGTDRLQEVATILGLGDEDVVVNVQGDEPLIPPAVINQVANNLHQCKQASAATLAEPITSVEQIFDSNVVKVVVNDQHCGMYFSRASIPWERGNFDGESPSLPKEQPLLRHIGIYAYRVALLKAFVKWPEAALEKMEKLEQLRILANGHQIHVEAACELVPGGVDTAEDLARVRALVAPL